MSSRATIEAVEPRWFLFAGQTEVTGIQLPGEVTGSSVLGFAGVRQSLIVAIQTPSGNAIAHIRRDAVREGGLYSIVDGQVIASGSSPTTVAVLSDVQQNSSTLTLQRYYPGGGIVGVASIDLDFVPSTELAEPFLVGSKVIVFREAQDGSDELVAYTVNWDDTVPELSIDATFGNTGVINLGDYRLLSTHDVFLKATGLNTFALAATRSGQANRELHVIEVSAAGGAISPLLTITAGEQQNIHFKSWDYFSGPHLLYAATSQSGASTSGLWIASASGTAGTGVQISDDSYAGHLLSRGDLTRRPAFSQLRRVREDGSFLIVDQRESTEPAVIARFTSSGNNLRSYGQFGSTLGYGDDYFVHESGGIYYTKRSRSSDFSFAYVTAGAPRQFVPDDPIITLSRGVLTIAGSTEDDIIEVGQNSRSVTVRGNSIFRSFPLSAVRKINVLTGNGPDEVTLNVDRPVWVDAGGGNDTISGTARDDVIFGREGDDYILGNGGNDELWGEAGRDSIVGGGGSDTIYGNGGRDTINGSGGNDRLFGGPDSADRLTGGSGFDAAAFDEKDGLLQIELFL